MLVLRVKLSNRKHIMTVAHLFRFVATLLSMTAEGQFLHISPTLNSHLWSNEVRVPLWRYDYSPTCNGWQWPPPRSGAPRSGNPAALLTPVGADMGESVQAKRADVDARLAVEHQIADGLARGR